MITAAIVLGSPIAAYIFYWKPFRWFFRMFYDEDYGRGRQPTWAGILGILGMSLLGAGLVGPAVAIGLGFRKLTNGRESAAESFGLALRGETQDEKLRRLEDEAVAREKEVRRLERELEIG